MPSFLHLYQLCMILNCLLNLLRLNADIPLRDGCGTVLKEPPHQCYVKAVCVVDFRCVPLAEAVGTDTLVNRKKLSKNRLQILFRSGDRCDVKLLHQEVQDIGGYESRQCGAKADVLDA